MTDTIQILAIAVSIVLLIVVIELVRRRKLTEEYSLVWIACALLLLFLSIARRLVDVAALWIGIYYPPAALLLLLILLVFVGAMSFSVTISSHRRQIERLVEHAALLESEIRALRDANARQGPDAARDAPEISTRST
jgi:hypothetical protein